MEVTEIRPDQHTEERVTDQLRRVMAWYASNVYGVLEGAGTTPFYCDRQKVGGFAVPLADLAAGSDAALFRLFVTLSMFQGVRDVLVMRHQRSLSDSSVGSVASVGLIARHTRMNDCEALVNPKRFVAECSVQKQGQVVSCAHHAKRECHVKDATVAFKRMGDMGKLPTSAWLSIWGQPGSVAGLLAKIVREEASPRVRARQLVQRLSEVHRVGVKLATFFVSALSTPALAPDVTPWYPAIDGNDLLVIDTNVARAVDRLRRLAPFPTDLSREEWLIQQASRLDLRSFCVEFPEYSPRILQQAVYWFCSRSNRLATLSDCSERGNPCSACAAALCPFLLPQA